MSDNVELMNNASKRGGLVGEIEEPVNSKVYPKLILPYGVPELSSEVLGNAFEGEKRLKCLKFTVFETL